MWQSRDSIDGLSSVVVTFPVPVTLTGVGVHSQHSGVHSAADGVRIEVPAKGTPLCVAEMPLPSPDVNVPLLGPAPAKEWRIFFHAENKKAVTIRGLRFFTRTGEIFPHPSPMANEKMEILNRVHIRIT